MEHVHATADRAPAFKCWLSIVGIAALHCIAVAALYVGGFRAPFAVPFALAANWFVLHRSPFIDLPVHYRNLMLRVPAFGATTVSFCISAVVAIIASGRGT